VKTAGEGFETCKITTGKTKNNIYQSDRDTTKKEKHPNNRRWYDRSKRQRKIERNHPGPKLQSVRVISQSNQIPIL